MIGIGPFPIQIVTVIVAVLLAALVLVILAGLLIH